MKRPRITVQWAAETGWVLSIGTTTVTLSPTGSLVIEVPPPAITETTATEGRG